MEETRESEERYADAQREIDRLREQLKSAQEFLGSEVVSQEGESNWYDWLFSGSASSETQEEAEESDWVTSTSTQEKKKGTKKKTAEELKEEIDRLKMHIYMQELSNAIDSTTSQFFASNPHLKKLEDIIRTKASIKLTELLRQNKEAATRPKQVAQLASQALSEAAKEVTDALREAGLNIAASSPAGATGGVPVSIPPSGGAVPMPSEGVASQHPGQKIVESSDYEVYVVPESEIDRIRKEQALAYIRDRVAQLEKQRLGPQRLQQIREATKTE